METKKVTLTILWLEHEWVFNSIKNVSPALEIIEYDLKFKIKTIFEDDFDPDEYIDSYQQPGQKFLDTIKKLTSKIGEDQIDIIVIGNNLGSGLSKAMAINCMKMEFTVIVHSMPIDEEPYKKMGFSNICRRRELGDKLLEMARIYRNSVS